jgi:Uncharacterised protein family (UPF0180).
MDVKVAVEKSLTPVRDFLTQKGYSVETIDFNREFTRGMDKYDAVVVTGIYENFLGVEDISTNAAIINAKGLTAEQIYTQIEKKLQ